MMRLTLSLLIVFLMSSAAILAQPSIKIVGGDVYDWGKVKPSDSPIKAKIELKNTGTDTLKITKVKPSCGCTTAPLEKDILAPGESSYLNVSLNIKNYSNAVQKTIRITTNDPKYSNKILKIKCYVERAITLLPKFVNFGIVSMGQEAIGKIVMRNTTDKDITIKEIALKPEDMKVNIEKETVMKPGEDLTLEVKYTPTAPGRISGRITLKTDNADATRLRINIYGNVKDGNTPSGPHPTSTTIKKKAKKISK